MEKHKLRYMLCFLLPAALMLVVYASIGMAPFGDKSILVMDMAQQYVDFFCALKEGDLFFSWGKSMGTSYIGLFSYYVSSPLSALTLLVDNAQMPLALMGLTVLKLGLAGLTFGLYHQRVLGGGRGAPLFACCYALMSYAVAYSMCIMWLDGLIWLPVILLGLEQMMDSQGTLLLGSALVVCFLSTWYISYMIGGFCCLYFAAAALCRGWTLRQTLGGLGRLLGTALLALALTAWMWLPSLLSMMGGKLTGGLADYSGLLAASPVDLLSGLLPGQYETLTYGGMPFVYCSLMVVGLALLHPICRSISIRERIAGAGLVGILVLSMVLSPLDRVWHLFLYPNWFMFRYSFLLSFVLVSMAARTAQKLEGSLKGRIPSVAALLLAVWTVGEVGWNARTVLDAIDREFGYHSYGDYVAHYEGRARLVQEAEVDSGGRFVRLSALTDRSKNEPLAFGYPGITHYSSLFDHRLNTTLKHLGLAQSWMWSACYGSTVVTDALFGVGYTIGPVWAAPGTWVAEADGVILRRSVAALPLVFAGEGTAPVQLTAPRPLERQNEWLSALSGWQVPVFVPANLTVDDDGQGGVLWTVEGTGDPIYADMTGPGRMELWVDGQFRTRLDSGETQCIHYLGTPMPGEQMQIWIRYTEGVSDWAALCRRADMDVLNAHLSRLNRPTHLEVDDTGRVWATLEQGENGTLFTSIPAQGGWTAWVDGRRVKTGVLLDTFLTVELPEGQHTVELRYTPPGLWAGMAMAALAILWMTVGRTRCRR